KAGHNAGLLSRVTRSYSYCVCCFGSIYIVQLGVCPHVAQFKMTHYRIFRSPLRHRGHATILHAVEISPEFVSLGLIWFLVFLFSTVCHESAHALVAKIGG